MIAKRESDQNKILIDIERFSSIENKDSECSEPFRYPKNNKINVSYVRVKINPEKLCDITQKKSSFSHR